MCRFHTTPVRDKVLALLATVSLPFSLLVATPAIAAVGETEAGSSGEAAHLEPQSGAETGTVTEDSEPASEEDQSSDTSTAANEDSVQAEDTEVALQPIPGPIARAVAPMAVSAGLVEVEPCSDTPCATPVPLGETVTGAADVKVRMRDSDWDFYRFDVGTSGRLTLDFTFPANLGTGDGYELFVINSAGSVVYEFDLGAYQGDGAWLKSRALYVSPGTWYVRINGSKNSATWQQPYNLKATVSPETVEVEFNNDTASATPISIGKAVAGAANSKIRLRSEDRDFYRFEVGSAGKQILNFAFPANLGAGNGYKLLVISPSGSVVQEFDIPASDWNGTGLKSQTISVTPGTWYIEVIGSIDSATWMQPYKLTVNKPSIPKVSTPTITGTAKVGSTLTAKPGTWTSGTTFKYAWMRNGATIKDATKATYKLVGADADKTITVKVTGTKTGYTSVAKTSAKTKAIAKGTLTAAVPTITGTASVGSTLTAKPGTWTSGSTFKYQWLREGNTISGATSSSYKLVSADASKTISVRVTGSKTGYMSTSKVSATVTALKPLKVATPTISGTAKTGSKLTAKAGTWTSGTTFSYQWLRDGKSISGANKQTYSLVGSDAGKSVSVKVTGKKVGYRTQSKTSTAVKVASLAPIPLQGSTPTISGSLKVGGTLTANPGTWTAGSTLTYQWYRNGAAISGATGPNYSPVSADALQTLSITVQGSKPGYTTMSMSSASTDVLRNLGTTLYPGGRIPTDAYLESSTGSHRLWVQSDGNLVLRNQNSGGTPIWSVNKYGANASLEFQTDGNVVLYSGGVAKFATNTVGRGASYLSIQPDGNLVLYAGSTAIWATGTNGK